MRNTRFVVSFTFLLLLSTAAHSGNGTWTTSYPEGGNIPGQGLTLDTSNGRLDAAPNWRRIYSSTDGAGSWFNDLDFRSDLEFDAINLRAVARGPDNVLYILAPYNGTNVAYRSLDDGANWTRADNGTSGDLSVLGFDPGDAAVIYAGNLQGNLFKTTDAAASWTPAGTGLPAEEVRSIEVDPVTATTVYVGVRGSGLYKSTDGGANFSNVNNNVTLGTVSDIAVDPANPLVVYVVEDSADNGIFKSVDGGASWTKLSPGVSFGDWNQTLLAFDPTDSNILYMGTMGEVWKTVDAGTNWTSATVAASVMTSVVIVDPATPSTLYAGTTGDGIYKSTDAGATWNEANSGLRARNFAHARSKSVHFDATTAGLIYAGSEMWGYRSTDNGATWSRMNAPDITLATIVTHPADPGGVWAVDNGLWRSTDSGVTWGDGSNGAFCCLGQGDVAVHPGDPSTVYVASTNDGVWKTTDGGTTWNLFNNGLGTTAIRILEVDPADGNVVYAATHEWYGTSGVWKTTDGGTNWFQLGGGLPDPINPHRILVHPADSNTIYLGAEGFGGLWKSTDGGNSWWQILDENVYTVASDPSDPNRVYAGTSNTTGFYRSLDGGATWALFVDGLPLNPGVNSMAVDPASSDRILIGTTGGLWEITFAGTLTIRVNDFSDSGPRTLRDAITQANQDGQPNVITFEPSMYGGVISPESTLPALTDDGTTIDGDLDDDCVPDLEINGWMVGGNGLEVMSSNNVIEGLAVHSFDQNGIMISPDAGPPADNNLIVCNYVGPDLSGQGGPGNTIGVHVRSGAAGNQVGAPGQPNVISGNAWVGVHLMDAPGTVVRDNFVGTTAGGGSPFGNGDVGILAEGTSNGAGANDHQIGPNNVIAWNGGAGVQVLDGMDERYPDFSGLSADATAQFPLIDFPSPNGCGPFTSADGITPLDGSGRPFVETFGARFTGTLNVDTAGDYTFDFPLLYDSARVVVDGTTVVDAQVCCPPFDGSLSLTAGDHPIEVDFRKHLSVALLKLVISGPGTATLSSGGQPGLFGELFQLRVPSERNTITENSIFENGYLGISLGGYCGPTANDPGDVDVGPNTRLNSPELTNATDDGGDLFTVSGTAVAGATVELFAVAADPSGHGEGDVFLASGTAIGGAFSIQVSRPADHYAVTATATDTAGNTSEFSADLELLPHEVTVTNTNDSGPGSLRDAMEQANNDAVSTVITIDPGLEGQTIFVLSDLPDLTEDGTTLDADLGGDCVPDLELDGTIAGGHGVMMHSSNNVVRGLVVNRFPQDGIHIGTGGANNVVECNYSGTEPDGVTPAPNGWNGVGIFVSDNRVGPGNVIAYNGQAGVTIDEDMVQDSFNAFDGLTPDYTGIFPIMEFHDNCSSFESADGITPLDGGGAPFTEHFGARFTGTIDVDTPGSYYFELENLDDRGRVLIDGNAVVDSDTQGCCNPGGDYSLSGSHSIEVDFEEGGGAAGFRLIIDGPGTATLSTGGQPGLYGELYQLRIPAEGNTITQNSIFDNDGLGIAFNCCCGPTQNDPGDADAGANTVLNFPELNSFTDLGGGSFTVDGVAPPDSTVEVFGAALDPSGFGEGKAYLGSTVADPAGNFSITASLPAEFDAFTATATDAAGNTSEFSQNLSVKSPDEVHVGYAEGFQGDTIEIPVYVRDLAATLLGVDQPAGNRIQGFTVQVAFQPASSVQAASAYHSGITAGLSPLFDTFVFTGDTLSYVASFDEATNPVPLTLDASAPGDEVARLVVTINPGAPPAPVQVTLLGGTTLSNQAGTLTEAEGSQLAFVHGAFNVNTRAATAVNATAISASEIRLRWNDPLADETGFRIDRSDDGGGSWSTIATAGPNDTEFVDSGLPSASLFYYRVTAFNGGFDAPPSNLAWAETFPASAARICVQQVSDDHSWMRFPDPAWNGSYWANAFQERTQSPSDDVYFQFLDGNGAPSGGWVSLSETDMLSRFPTLRWNGSRYGVMWSEHMRGPLGEVTSNNFFGLLEGNGQVVRKKVRLFDQVPLGGLNSDVEWAFDWDGGGWGYVAPDFFSPPSANLGFWRFSEDGETITGPVQVSFASGRETDVSLVWNGSVYGVAWLRHDGAVHELLFRRFNADGSSPDPGPVTIWSAAAGESAAYTALLWNGSGWAVAWDVIDSGGFWPLYIRLLAADGTPLGAAQRMSDDEDPTWPGSGLGPYDELPEIAPLPGGGYVAYTSSYAYATGAYEIARLEADAAGSRVGARTILSDDDGWNSIYGRLASNGSHDLLLFNEHRQGSQETGGLLVAPDGSVPSYPDLSCCHSPGNSYGTQGASVGGTVPVGDGFLSLVTDAQSGSRQIYAQLFDAAGNPAASYWPLSGRDVRGTTGVEGLGDTFAVAWKDGSNTIVFARYFADGSGSLFGEVDVAYDTGGRSGVALAYSGEAYGLVYFNGNDVVLQRVDMNGGLIGGPVTVADNGRQIPMVQWTGAGWAVIYRASDLTIFYALVDAWGSVIAGPAQVTAGPSYGPRYDLIWNGDNLGLVWAEDRGVAPEGPEVYFNVLDLNGTPLLADVLVHNSNWVSFPQLYWSGDRFHVLRTEDAYDRDGTHEDEILPDGTLFADVRQHTNRGAPGFVAFNGTTMALQWPQLNEVYLQTDACLDDATPPDCPDVSLSTSDDAVEIDWSGVGDAESTIWRYNLYRDGFMLAELFPQTLHYSDTGYRPGTAHTYEVRALNGAYTESQGCATVTYSTTVGDGNGDGVLDTADIFYLIQYLLAGGPAPAGDADANGDGSVDFADIFYLINHLFGGGPPPVPLLPPAGPADVLFFGTVEASAGSTVDIPVYVRDVAGTPLGGDAVPVQGFAFRLDFDAAAVASVDFRQAGTTASLGTVFSGMQLAKDHLTVLLSFTQAVPLQTDAPPPGDQVGTVRLTLAAGAGPVVPLVADAASILVDESGTIAESPARETLQLIDGAVLVDGATIFRDGFEWGDTSAWSKTVP